MQYVYLAFINRTNNLTSIPRCVDDLLYLAVETQGAKETEEVLDLRQDVREWQSSCGRRARFSYLCERWVGVASDIEEKQRQKRMCVEILVENGLKSEWLV